jgi:DNA-binding response OmpR family regulator
MPAPSVPAASNPTGVTAAGKVTERAQRARQHVFLVNGSSAFLDVVRALLEVEDYNITTTNYVPLTFPMIETLRPDLLIVDVVYGIQAGWYLLEQLAHAAHTQTIPVIVTSTNHSLLERATELARPGGQKRYLDMPFEIATLLAMVHELIGAA